MVAGEEGVGQVVEAAAAGPALGALPLRLGLIPALLDDRVRVAMRAVDAIRPAEVADHLVALGVVGDPQDVDEHGGHPDVARERTTGPLGLDCRARFGGLHSSPWNTG